MHCSASHHHHPYLAALEAKFGAAASEMEARFQQVLREKDERVASAEKRRAAAEAVHNQLAEVYWQGLW